MGREVAIFFLSSVKVRPLKFFSQRLPGNPNGKKDKGKKDLNFPLFLVNDKMLRCHSVLRVISSNTSEINIYFLLTKVKRQFLC